MSALRPQDDTQPIPVVRGRHAAPRPRRSLSGHAVAVAREAGIVLAIVAVVVIGARLLVGQVAYVGDDAMAPTLAPGERVLVTPWGSPTRGDVILVTSPDAWGTPDGAALVRVIGLPGDRVACCDAEGRITVNGTPRVESYVAGATDQVSFDVVVPEGRVFVLADDRTTARDSRAIIEADAGTVDLADVRGRVIAVLWPPRPLAG